ncbi:MAG: RNA-guided pseudouridylation complex pseudouridine synthase subunit Cbf5 [Methanoregulaceae archaeon]|nr:RNA-guided pseudouridylation complex pseudouridine synthase subunit Cbf5 [Methanoregulaceae archaeon]
MERRSLTGPGIVVIDKPRGPTSHQVTAWVREMLGVQAGHTGTLDPDVSGVLVVMLSTAVRLAPLLAGDMKEYTALMRVHGDVTRDCMEQVLGEFSGRIYQRPPRRSAVARALRIRTIHHIELLEFQHRLILIRVRCDAGTYIRSLCHHIGLALGTGAHMQELRRISSGGYSENAAHTLQELADAAFIARGGDFGPMESLVIPAEKAVSGIPSVTIRDTAVDAVCHGAALAGVGIASADPFEKGERVAIFSKNGELIAIGKALVPSPPFQPGSPGLVIAPGPVFMPPDTYPRGWIKK